MTRVLVGVDGSAAAESALRWAARLSAGLRGELIVATAWAPQQAEVPPSLYDELKATAIAQFEHDWCQPARDDGVASRCLFLEGHPGDTLLRAADTEEVDLLVVGNRGAGGFAGLLVGSVAHHLAHHATRPLAIIPKSGGDRRLGHLVVGVDGSKGGLAATKWVARTAAALDASVTAVWVFEPFVEWVPEYDLHSWRRQADQDLAAWTKPLADLGVTYDSTIVEDIHPVSAIARVGEEHGAAMVVVGTTGLGGFHGMRLGRVPLQLLHHAGRPVVMVPAD